ncbi:hypothetical protein L593_11775 [Salinarchaeum sp. Harcht-Bsk1]|uniref:hypothetical protein n=1 Tax=Salinarchaeum sp. Harcht-Bsk1 TaxID=1333523 RepID=UPI00034234AF|nr:hypothetical protein [Salinarchaeum sp. Harcht-Bsk1]AGN02298.1 hypothetical protein L593_11775 [Salinarchaeum sp. Harcht-Bsk1]
MTQHDQGDERRRNDDESNAGSGLSRRGLLGVTGSAILGTSLADPAFARSTQSDDETDSISYGTVTWVEVDEDDPEGLRGHYESVSFQGEAGDVVEIRVYPPSTAADYGVTLVLEAESVVGSEQFTDGQAEGRRIGPYELPETKAYQILVTTSEPADTGAFQLELEKVGSGGSTPAETAPPDAPFAARLVDSRANALAGGTVRVYRDEDDEQLASSEVGDGGWVTLDAGTLESIGAADRVHVLARSGDWFDGFTFEGGSLAENHGEDLPLRRELLYGPEIADSGSGPLGVVSVWRQIGFPDPALQTICVEVTNAATAAEPSNVGTRAFDLTDGLISLSYPEDDVLVSYGAYTDVEHPREMDVASVGTPHEGSMSRDREERPRLPVEVYHPARTGVPMGGTSIVSYEPLETSAAEERINEGTGRIVSSLPFVGMALGIGDLLHWGFGDPVERSASLGVEDPMPVDPNRWDTATLPWTSDSGVFEEASVLGVFPVRLDTDESTTIDVRAEWTMESVLFGFGTGSGSFARQFEIGPY